MKRALRIAAVLLVFGAIVNVAIAWASAAWCPLTDQPWQARAERLGERDWWIVASYRGASAGWLHSLWGQMPRGWVDGLGQSPDELAGRWKSILSPQARSESSGARMVDARGWPMLSMWSALEFETVQQRGGVMPGAVTRVIRGIQLETRARARPSFVEQRILPLGLIWSGFAINTIAFAASGALVLGLLAFSRRALRAGAGHCPRCAYDLRDGSSDRCSECGARVQPGRVGSRRARLVRRGVILGWSAMLLTALVVGGAWAERHPGWKPVWWLRLDARSASAPRSSVALSELIERMKANDLPKATIASLVADALAIQADATCTWVPQWGDVVVFAHSNSLIMDGQWRTFAQQAVAPELRVRREVVVGDSLAAELFVHFRGPSDGALCLDVKHFETHLGATVLRGPLGELHRIQFKRVPLVGHGFTLNYEEPSWSFAFDDDERGEYLFRSQCTVVVADGTLIDSPYSLDSTDSLFFQPIELEAQVRILPRGSETVELIVDEKLRRRLETILVPLPLEAAHPFDDDQVTINGGFDFDEDPPIDFAFDVFMRAGEQEWRVGEIDSERVLEQPFGLFRKNIKDLTAETVDLILRPSQERARRTIGITRIWGGTIVIENVPVEWKDE